MLFEGIQGEVFKSGPADFDSVDNALEWLTIVEETRDLARAAAELQDHLQTNGEPLAARDAYIPGAANGPDERLAVADSDFDVDGLAELVDVDVL